LRTTRDSPERISIWPNVYTAQGQYEKAAESFRQKPCALHPDESRPLRQVSATTLICLATHLDETRQIIRRGTNPKTRYAFIIPQCSLRSCLYQARTRRRWLNSSSGLQVSRKENFGLSLASDTEAYGGHLGKARELTKRAVDSAIRADSKENGAIWQEIAAVSGKPLTAILRKPGSQRRRGLKLAPTSQGVRGRSRACVRHGGRYGTSRVVWRKI
jgi:hypothetical protein